LEIAGQTRNDGKKNIFKYNEYKAKQKMFLNVAQFLLKQHRI